LIASVALLAGMATPARAAPVRGRPAAAYSDPAFTFAYPDGWTSIPQPTIQQVTSVFGGLEAELHVTDVGGVTSASGQTSGAVILVMRLRLSRTLRLQVINNRAAFAQAILNGVATAARRILNRGSTTIGGHPANQMEYIQGAGSVRLHERLYVVLSTDAKRLFLVYFISRKRDWSGYLPAFTTAAASMTFSPSP